ncbi:DnaJ domain-containing protein [bacterium]|nr:DnaJ domain-containing protein [bacterium]
MSKFQNYLWLIIVLLYLIVPLDLYPGLLDDILVLGSYLFFLYRYLQKSKQARAAYGRTGKDDPRDSRPGSGPARERATISVPEAYRILGVSPTISPADLQKAYHARMAENHPDKVSHLSRELREHAHHLTLRINKAYATIKHHKNIA